MQRKKMNKLLWMMLSGLMVLPISSHADVYKWKDKDGVTRYSDTPPPSNVEQLPITGKKAPAPRRTEPQPGAAPASPVTPAANSDAKKPAASLQGEAIKRQQIADEDKKKTEQAEAEQKVKQQNCATAKANLQNYQQGGRIYKMNEQGERQFMGDADIAQNLEQAKQEVQEYCES
jgi:hypothetical protein